MSSVPKVFTTYEWCGDQHGEQPALHTPVIPSDPERLLQELMKSIDLGDVTLFKQLLTQDFIYAGCLKKVVYRESHAIREWREFDEETYRVRPTIEAFYSDYKKQFHQLILSLRALPSKQLTQFYNVLRDSFGDTDLSKINLFAWYGSLKEEINHKLSQLGDYGSLLSEQGEAKGSTLSTLVNELKQELNRLTEIASGSQNPKDKLKLLDFKLQFIEKLHQHDKEFSQHRSIARLITNIASLIFVGIPNIINKITTGNWLFFNQTRTQKLIASTEESFAMSIE